MDYPLLLITCQPVHDEMPATVAVHTETENIQIDKAALAHVIQQYLLDNVPDIASTTAEIREQTYPVTALPPLGR